MKEAKILILFRMKDGVARSIVECHGDKELCSRYLPEFENVATTLLLATAAQIFISMVGKDER